MEGSLGGKVQEVIWNEGEENNDELCLTRTTRYGNIRLPFLANFEPDL